MKKLISIVLCVVLALGVLAGCGNTATTDDGAAKEKLVMATNAAFPPYEFYENEKIVGIDADIAAAIAEKLGMELEIQDTEFGSIITGVQSGKYDIGMAGMTVTEERKLTVNFSDTYATGIQSVIVKDGSEIKTIEDIEGKKIGVQTGTTGDIYCSGDYGDDAVARYDNGALAVAALKNGQVDCVVIDNEPAKAFVAANEGLKILDTEYITENYAAAIAKDNTELLEKFNAALAELKADGTIDTIIGKYIKAE